MRGSGNDKKAGRKEPKKGSKGSNGQKRQNNSEYRGRVEGKIRRNLSEMFILRRIENR